MPIEFQKGRMLYIEEKNKILKNIRKFFYEKKFLEVETPIIIKTPCIEEHINALKCDKYFLRTSPELFHKKILSDGYNKIFEIGKCFRDNEKGRLHHPEYTMLEWYCLHLGYEDILIQTYDLLTFLLNKFDKQIPEKKIFTVKEIFLKLDNWNPIKDYDSYRFDDVLYKKVEPFFKEIGGIIFLKDYPADAAALAKLSDTNKQIAERWELYLDGVEIANAYSELTDAKEQKDRFISCQNKRSSNQLEVYDIDSEFIDCLDYINSAGGCALGVDRLLAWFCNEDSLDNFVYRNIFD